METTEKKPKNGFDRLKVKYAKLKAEKEEIISKQATKIKNLSNDLSNAQAAAENYRIKYETALAHVPFWRKWFNEL